jgi:tyrosyl-tRNA synthetase
VKNKMKNGDGMSFAEFTYPLLQAWDWWHMYNTMGIRMQIGGSDQYGNITAGMDAVKYIAANHPAPDTPKKTKKEPFGLTSPLLTTSSGAKFGKSAGNAIWLDSEMTSIFDLYGYFLRTSDEDVERYLKLFTFMPIEDISTLMEKHREHPSQRKAQHKLASEFVELVHGKNEAKNARTQHDLIFKKPQSPDLAIGATTSEDDPFGVGVDALKQAQVNVNNKPKAHLKLPRTVIEHLSIAKILYACGLAESASDGHRLVQGDAVHIGGPPSGYKTAMNDGSLTFTIVQPWRVEETKKFLIEDRLLILRRGKHNVRIIELVDDEEYEKLGLSYPGKDKVDLQKAIGKIPQKSNLEDDSQTEAEKEVPAEETRWSPVRDEQLSWQEDLEDPSPEARIERLRRELQAEEDERQRKIDKKNAPKGKFIAHGQPRGPVPQDY